MADALDALFQDDPRSWVQALEPYQRRPIEELLAQGRSYEDVAESWLSARTEHTSPFGAVKPGEKSLFLEKLKLEVEAFLCGESRYGSERQKLFGEAGLARTYFVSAVAVAVAPALGVSATVLAPAVALVLASLGKITVNAWCAARREARERL